MHAILVTMGTFGDVFPFIGLGVQLRARGHRVTLAANEHYRSTAADHDLEFRSLVSEEETRALMGNSDVWHPLKSALLGARWAVPLLARQYADLMVLARDPGSVLVAYPPLFSARLVHEKLGCRLVSLVVMPWMIPSLCDPPTLPRPFQVAEWAPRWMVRGQWRFLETMADYLVGPAVNRLRRSLGLPGIRGIVRWAYSSELTLGMFPETYAAIQADWPVGTRLAGFPLYDGAEDEQLPVGLRDFCRAGPAPVAFTYGTGNVHAQRFFRMAIDACARAGVRGVLLTRDRAQLPDRLPDFVHHCSFAPFGKLFPHCSAVVHHGGMGTTAQALVTGLPQLILPMAWDQPDNAARVKRLGTGISLPSRCRASVVAAAIRRVQQEDFRDRCRSVAQQLGSADALTIAADLLETYAAEG